MPSWTWGVPGQAERRSRRWQGLAGDGTSDNLVNPSRSPRHRRSRCVFSLPLSPSLVSSRRHRFSGLTCFSCLHPAAERSPWTWPQEPQARPFQVLRGVGWCGSTITYKTQVGYPSSNGQLIYKRFGQEAIRPCKASGASAATPRPRLASSGLSSVA